TQRKPQIPTDAGHDHGRLEPALPEQWWPRGFHTANLSDRQMQHFRSRPFWRTCRGRGIMSESWVAPIGEPRMSAVRKTRDYEGAKGVDVDVFRATSRRALGRGSFW